MTRGQAQEFDQFLLKFDTLTIEMSDSRRRVEKVVERLQNKSRKKNDPMPQDCD